MKGLYVVGLGPGNLNYSTQAALKTIGECDVLVGGRRNLDSLKHFNKDELVIDSRLDEVFQHVDKIRKEKMACVAVSGDPGFYSLLGYINRRYPKEEIRVIPGISSFQYLFCKLGRQWNDYMLFSLHGESVDLKKGLLEYIQEGKGVFLLTDKFFTPVRIAHCIANSGYDNRIMIVGENLSYEDERITIGKPKDIIKERFSDLNVVVIDKDGI